MKPVSAVNEMEHVAAPPASKLEAPTQISENGLEVLRRRYLRKGPDGKPMETVPEMFWRVASNVALPERAYEGEEVYLETAEEFYDLLNTLRFFPNSPTFTGAGTPLGQLAACQPYHARVVTERGLIPIGELVEAQSRENVVAFGPPETDEPVSAYLVAAAHRGPLEFGRIQAAVHNGVKPVVRLTVFGGLHLDVTPDHMVWASPPAKHGRFAWHQAGEVGEGWLLMVDTRPKPFSTENVEGFDEAMAAVVAWLQADGYVGQPRTATSPIIEFETINDDEYEWIQNQISRSPLAEVHQHVREHVVQDETLQYRRIRIYGQAPYNLLGAYCVTQRKENARVPEQVFRSPSSVVASYVRALFQCDGTVERSGFISLASVSQPLLEGVQQLLLQFGICSQIIGYTRRRGGRLPSYKLHIGLYSSRVTFEQQIGFISREKREKLAALNQRGGKQQSPLRAIEVDRVVSLGEMPVYDIQTTSSTYLSAHIAVHNCFVLGIDDDMGKDSSEGIFNTLRNAALIQQTGGGNGFSFSRLRPRGGSVNSSAGVASGPVGFLKVYDAAFGEIAQGGCLTPDSLVFTSDGLLRLDELVDPAHSGWQEHSLSVPTDDGERTSPRGFNNGVQPVLSVQTREGLSLTGTLNHKVKVMADEGPAWRRLDELKPGDAILVMLGQHQGRLRALRRPIKTHGNQAEIGLPPILDETLAFVLGYLAGDGFVAAEPQDHRIGFSVAHDSYLLDELPLLLQQVFPGCKVHRQQKVDDASVTYVVDSAILKQFVIDNGFAKPKSHEVTVPRLVRQSPATVAGAYLRGLFEADGGLSHGYPQLNTTSQRLAQEVATLLIGLGCPVTIRSADYSGRLGKRPQWIVRITSHVGLEAWRQHIGCDQRSRFVTCFVFRPDTERESSYALPASAYWLQPVLDDITLPQIDRRSRGQGVNLRATDPQLRKKLLRYLRDERQLTMSAYRELSAASPEFAQHARPVANLWFVHVAETCLAGEQLTLDLEVDGNHTYLANGLVTHNTRRGANMGVLRVDHPDIEEFIACKAKEGQIANFNISVGVTDAFMEAVKADTEYDLINPHTKKVTSSVRARDIFDKISHYAHRNGEPGVLFLDAANRSNPVPHLYELEATNPCITGDTLIYTDTGLRKAWDLHASQETPEVILDGRFGADAHQSRTSPVFYTGIKPVYRLTTSEGYELDATGNHLIMTVKGWVALQDLRPGDKVHLLNRKGGFGSEGNQGFGRVLGWLLGDSTFNTADGAGLLFFGDDQALAPEFAGYVNDFVGVERHRNTYAPTRTYTVGTVEIAGRHETRVVSKRLKELLAAIEVIDKEHVPTLVYTGSEDMQRGFLQGLFSSDGTILDDVEKGVTVRLWSCKRELLKDVQRLLLNFGIASKVYCERKKAGFKSMPDGRGGQRSYFTQAGHELVISKQNLAAFKREIGFLQQAKADRLADALLSYGKRGPYAEYFTATVKSLELWGEQPVYDLTEPLTHSFVANGIVVHNCGEQFLGPYENCCLGSINLAQHVTDDGKLDWAKLEKTVVESTRFLDDVVSANKYVPAVPQLQDAAHRVRRIGLGIMGLADVMYRLGVRYGDEESLDLAGQVMEFVRYHCMRTSIDLARERGPFLAIEGSIYDPNNLKWQPPTPLQPYTHEFGRPVVDWDAVVEGIKVHGIRNGAQTTVAPTGCLVPGTMVTTDQGVLPIETLGDVRGERWQDIDLLVASEGGSSWATKFYVNGRAHTLRAMTKRGYVLQGTDQHRIRVWQDGAWVWQRMDELRPGMKVPLQPTGLIGEPQRVTLDTRLQTDFHATPVTLPTEITADLAYLIGFFMGDGSLKDRSLRFAISDAASEVRITSLIRSLFGAEPTILKDNRSASLRSVELHSRNVVSFWINNGLAKNRPNADHSGKGYQPFIPLAVLRTNDADVYGAFLAGLFDADGTVHRGQLVTWLTTDRLFHDQVKALLLILGVLTTSDLQTTGLGQSTSYRLRTAHADAAKKLMARLPYLCRLHADQHNVRRTTLGDTIPLTGEEYVTLLAVADSGREEHRVWSWRQSDLTASRDSLARFVDQHRSDLMTVGLQHLVTSVGDSIFYDELVAIEDGGWQETYDLSVPGPHAYIANGFVSHNTIGTVTGCEGYGCEPVFALAYTRYVKEASGDVTLTYVSPLFIEALDKAGITGESRERIVDQIVLSGTCQGVDELPQALQHTFVVSQDITAEQHVLMQAALQCYVDNSISKTINCPSDATPGDIKQVYMQAWELGCKGLTVYVTGSRQEVVLETKATADAKKAGTVEVVPNGHAGVEETLVAVPHHVDVAQPNGTSHHIGAAPEYQSYDIKRPRPKRLHGATYRRLTPLGTAYVTVNDTEEGEPFEVFMNVGKAGSDVAAVSEALGRLISLALRMPSSLSPTERLQQVVYQLNGIGGGRHLGFGPQRVRSLPDAIAQVLAEHLEEVPAPAPHLDPPAEQLALPIPKQIGDLCPDCGNSTLLNIEGCRKCHVCGYSEC